MKLMRYLVVTLAVAVTLVGCGGPSTEDTITSTIQKDLAADTGLHPGLTMGGMIMGVTDETSSYFTGMGPRAENVKVDNVTVNDSGKTARAKISFGLVGDVVTCEGSAMTSLSSGKWDLTGIVVTSCQ